MRRADRDRDAGLARLQRSVSMHDFTTDQIPALPRFGFEFLELGASHFLVAFVVQGGCSAVARELARRPDEQHLRSGSSAVNSLQQVGGTYRFASQFHHVSSSAAYGRQAGNLIIRLNDLIVASVPGIHGKDQVLPERSQSRVVADQFCSNGRDAQRIVQFEFDRIASDDIPGDGKQQQADFHVITMSCPRAVSSLETSGFSP